MRTIKFKVWDSFNKKFLDYGVVNIYDLVYGEDKLIDELYGKQGMANECLEFLQWTGLTDKNGKEIYEGDIINIMEIYEEKKIMFGSNPYVVKFGEFWNGEEYEEYQSGNGWYAERLYLKKGIVQNVDWRDLKICSLYSGEPFSPMGFEVIGNIYESSELLTDQENTN